MGKPSPPRLTPKLQARPLPPIQCKYSRAENELFRPISAPSARAVAASSEFPGTPVGGDRTRAVHDPHRLYRLDSRDARRTRIALRSQAVARSACLRTNRGYDDRD